MKEFRGKAIMTFLFSWNDCIKAETQKKFWKKKRDWASKRLETLTNHAGLLQIRQRCNMTRPSGYYNSLTLPVSRRGLDLSTFVVQCRCSQKIEVQMLIGSRFALFGPWEGPNVEILALLHSYFSYFPWLCGILQSQSHVLSIISCCSHGLILFPT